MNAIATDTHTFEAGLFGSALGLRRTFILHARDSKLPTDLLGLTTAPNQVLRVASINPGIEVGEGEIGIELRGGEVLALMRPVFEALAVAHERTRAGIEARLVKHGRLAVEQAPAARIR